MKTYYRVIKNGIIKMGGRDMRKECIEYANKYKDCKQRVYNYPTGHRKDIYIDTTRPADEEDFTGYNNYENLRY